MGRFDRYRRWFLPALVLVAALGLTAASPGETGAQSRGPGASDQLGQTVPGLGKELPARRTRSSRTFMTPERTLLTRVFPGPVNFRDADGEWQAIDNTLVQTPSGDHRNRAGDISVTLPADAGTDPARVASDGDWVETQLFGAKGDAVIDGATATYAGALPGVDVNFTVGNEGLKENLVLAGPSSPRRFSYRLRTSPGLRAIGAPDGSILLRDASGPRFALEAPVMYDRAGASSRALSLRLGTRAGETTVDLVPDAAWLASPKRAWPIVVDPTLTKLRPTRDCHITSGTLADTSACTGASLDVGYDATATRRGLLQFDVAGGLLPSGDPKHLTVLDAELGLYLGASSTTAPVPVGLHALSRSWTSGATWNRHDGVGAWASAGGDFNATAAYTNPSVGGSLGWSYWQPTELVQGWIDGSVANNGLLVKAEPDWG